MVKNEKVYEEDMKNSLTNKTFTVEKNIFKINVKHKPHSDILGNYLSIE